ncbi:MAG TPA: cysteine-rich CWC family protein [Burkholderiaceae bacterium]|nr:cysteine-rich CWC family protein [Burkholderiaceae bacterium]
MESLPNHICPVCGSANYCAPAQAGHLSVDCWCNSVVINQAALDRVPEDLRRKACLCPKCATCAKPASV